MKKVSSAFHGIFRRNAPGVATDGAGGLLWRGQGLYLKKSPRRVKKDFKSTKGCGILLSVEF